MDGTRIEEKNSMKDKQLSNPFSTGGGGGHFEAHVQASFVALMITGGYAPCLPCWPIVEIKVQGKIDGFNTDDLIVFVEEPSSKERCKMLGQVKHKIRITKGDNIFSEVIRAAWNDFNNPRVFAKEKDIIALITGSLSTTDSYNVQWLLSQARHTKDADEFERNVKQANFSPAKSVVKLEAIKHHLRLANGDQEISKEDLYSFLKHFYLLGYDLGEEDGVVLSLLHSHISQFNRQYPHWIWSRAVDIVQTWNQNAGTITPDKLPDDLKELFKQPAISYIPAELMAIQPEPAKTDWNSYQHAGVLAIISLIGSWNEKNEADLDILNSVINEEYSIWIQKCREILQLEDSPLSLKNGFWKITERTVLWDMLGSRIYDKDLDNFKEAIMSVLTERDISFEFSPEERYTAGIHGKVLTHSQALRKGLAESLALLGNRDIALINCSQDKAKTTVVLTIREIFEYSDWVLWGSLNSLLPILAEAAPNEFLNAVENALYLKPCPFDELFSQESCSIMGENYLTGLLWALETLAWDENYLVRVCIALGELANHDPGGNWANRPANSLTTILLPWFPQTIATIAKRKVAVQTLYKECPDVSWKLIISLLPNQYQTSTGSHKPSWRDIIPKDWEVSVTNAEYWDQVSFYAELAVSMASEDIVKISEIIDYFDNLPKPSFYQLLELLSSEETLGLSEEERFPIWNKLIKFISKHRSFPEAEWAIEEDLLLPIEEVANKLSPSNPLNLYQRLFTEWEIDLSEGDETWEEQEKKISERRQKGVTEILDFGGINSVIQFSEIVRFPILVGENLGRISDEVTDSVLLPVYLESKNSKHLEFINGYVKSRYYINGWIWVDGLDKTSWNEVQIGQFLSFLPFVSETWARTAKWLKDRESEYWYKVNPNIHQAETDFAFAIDKLIEYGRPHVAISCLNTIRYLKKKVNVDQCIKALISALSSDEPSYLVNAHHIVELIKIVQEAPEVLEDELFQIEWAYLKLLDHHYRAYPKLLENRLANNPEFFCEVIRLIYRSTKTDAMPSKLTEETRTIAANAWRLLHYWRTPPGVQKYGSFDNEHFLTWLQCVKEKCTESGHLEVALINVGEVLIHCPADLDGLWINHTVANALNARDAEDMRRGFSTGIYNSRGTNWVDHTGKPEIELAEQYRQKAEDIENAGYQRFAVTLRNLSETYDREAERIVSKHRNEKSDE